MSKIYLSCAETFGALLALPMLFFRFEGLITIPSKMRTHRVRCDRNRLWISFLKRNETELSILALPYR